MKKLDRCAIRPIPTGADYRVTLALVAPYFGNEPEAGSDTGAHFEAMITLIEAYEAKHYPPGTVAAALSKAVSELPGARCPAGPPCSRPKSAGEGFGQAAAADALYRCHRLAEEIGSVGVIVDAKNARAQSFYSQMNFEEFPEAPLTLWLLVEAVTCLFEGK